GPASEGESGSWARVLAPAWAESAVLAGLLALFLVLLAPDARPQSATLTALAGSSLLLAWALRKPEFTWLGSVLLLAAIGHLLLRGIAAHEVPHSILVALLAHATLVLALRLSLKRLTCLPPLQRLLIAPLGSSATLSSLLAIPAIVLGVGGQLGALSLWTLWLAGLWLVVACLNRRAELFAAFQAALSFSVLFAVGAWIKAHAPDPPAPRVLQLYGIGLAILSLFWVVVRIRLRSFAAAEIFLSPSRPAVDRVVLAGLVVAQLGLAMLGLLPGLLEELIPRSFASLVDFPDREWVLSATGLPAWALLVLLAAALATEIRVRLRASVVLGLLALALTVPVLVAGGFAEQRAVASGLRWGAGIVLLICSLPIWLRHRLAPWGERI